MQKRSSVPQLDLSFSCDSFRSIDANKDNKQQPNISLIPKAEQTPRSQHAPDIDQQSPPLSVASNRSHISGIFTPYNENITARRLLEREFTDVGYGRQVVEDQIVYSENGSQRKSRPTSALLSYRAPEAKRVSFTARLLVMSDCDALREFTGFFWEDDSSFAVYEFRGPQKFSNRTTPRVLPFVPRGRYVQAGGIRQGKDISLIDIAEGRDVVLSISNDSLALNDALRQRSVFILRITNVDLTQKKSILLKDVRISDHETVLAKMHAPQSSEEKDTRAFMFSIRTAIKKALKNRGIRTLLNMRHQAGISVKLPKEKMDEESYKNKYNIGKEQLVEILNRCSIKLEEEAIGKLFNILDTDGNGSVDFGEFLRGIIGGMSETRHEFVKRAWVKMDPAKTGRLTASTISKFYSARLHPDVISGDRTAQSIVSAFISMLQPPERVRRFSVIGDDGEPIIGFGEFETYYEGLSLAVDSDEDFLNILKETWGQF